MTEEFDLSKRDISNILGKSLGVTGYRGEDVKEFIRRLKGTAQISLDGINFIILREERLDKLAGEKLI